MNEVPEYKHLPDILISASRTSPHKDAIIFGQRRFTYHDLYKKSAGIACALKEKGIQKGARVALLLDNSPEFVFCYFGILLAGSIVVPVNHMFKRDEIKYILEDSEANCLITSSVYAEVAVELSTIVSSLKDVFYTNLENPNTLSLVPYLTGRNKTIFSEDDIDSLGSDTAVFLYTSGTTGHPKAAMLTHDNLLWNACSASQMINVTAKDIFICFLPLFHSFAATVCMIMPLYKKSKIVILKSPRPIKKLFRSIRKNRITIFVGIPSIYSILRDMKLPRFLPRFLLRFFNPIRLAISGAAALPVKVFLNFEKKYGLPLLEGYGLTEASPIVSLNPLRGARKPGSIGLPLPGISVKIIDEQNNELEIEKVGELCVKGPNIMRGYFKKGKETAETLKNNWLLTGDMAKIDKDGYITIMGRKKEMVNVRGLNVYPREIEEVLYQNPKIKEAAVIGIPDPHKGEVPKGFVVLKTGNVLTEHEIILYLREHLALYKVPKRIEIRNELPKNASGKILKRLLE